MLSMFMRVFVCVVWCGIIIVKSSLKNRTGPKVVLQNGWGPPQLSKHRKHHPAGYLCKPGAEVVCFLRPLPGL